MVTHSCVVLVLLLFTRLLCVLVLLQTETLNTQLQLAPEMYIYVNKQTSPVCVPTAQLSSNHGK